MRSRFSILSCLCLYFIVLTVPSVDRYGAADASTTYNDNNKEEESENQERSVTIGKCCELDELFVDDTCTPIEETNETRWQPEFVMEKGDGTVSRDGKASKYHLKIGLPNCESNERQWKVYHHSSGQDRLAIILPSGHLRHYTADLATEAEEWAVLNAMDDDEVQGKFIHLDYAFGHYCIDKVVLTRDHLVASYAIVCVPEVAIKWTDTGYLMRHVVDPVFHAISIASYLIVAVVYFVLPQLRDLVGNMITTMTLCLIISQCASIVTAFTEFGNHFNFLIADFVHYISLLAAFFWLNALGYYVWNTFRSRNVFLRVTDGKKYCYYSTYVWGSTLAIAATAIFAHVALETEPVVIQSPGSNQSTQEIIGWLGLSVLFMSIAFTIAVDLCFVLTTANRIKRMNTYGRIHHKMKYSFKMFVFLYTIMSFGWISILFSRLQLETLVYWNIVVNLLQALFVLYVCVFGQRRVTFLLSKTCNCCNSGDNTEGLDWGEEMTAINAGY